MGESNTNFMIFRRPGNHRHLRDFRPVGFASPAFTGFAIIGYFLSRILFVHFFSLTSDGSYLKENGEPWKIQARHIGESKTKFMIFRRPGNHITCVTLDPLALRPRLSPGLLLSDFFFTPILYHFHHFVLYTFVMS